MPSFVINAKKDAVRNQVLQVLAKEHPLSLTNIHNRISAKFGTRVSFQATRKAANLLVENLILTRSPLKEYEISRKWILESKKLFDLLSDSYTTKSRSKVFAKIFRDVDYAEYKLNSLFELDNFWDEVIMHWADNLGQGEPKEAYTYNNFHWWFLINYGTEVKLWEYLKKKGIRGGILSPQANFINKMAPKVYSALGYKVRLCKERLFPESTDINILGNHVIQVIYPKDVIKKFSALTKKYASVTEVDPKELSELVTMKSDLRLVYLSNAEIARNYKEQILKHF